LKDFQKATG